MFRFLVLIGHGFISEIGNPATLVKDCDPAYYGCLLPQVKGDLRHYDLLGNFFALAKSFPPSQIKHRKQLLCYVPGVSTKRTLLCLFSSDTVWGE